MWTLLFALTALVVVAPMIPALVEWRYPSDVAPLHIDAKDALDPTWPARSAAARVLAAIASGATQIGGRPIAHAPQVGYWPLETAELEARSTQRVWHARGHAALPPQTGFVGEVISDGHLETSPDNTYTRLWSGDCLHLAEASVVEQWAHGASIVIESRCLLEGRVTAETSITVQEDCRFILLQAPTIRFSPNVAQDRVRTPHGLPPVVDLPPLTQDHVSGRRFSAESLDLGARRSWNGDLVCHGDLVIGAGCRSTGNIKARGRIVVGPACVIDGALVAEGTIDIDRGCLIQGVVVSEVEVHLGAGTRVGTIDRPTTVSAPRITTAAGVIVHGTIWAEVEGRTDAAPVGSAANASLSSGAVMPVEAIERIAS